MSGLTIHIGAHRTASSSSQKSLLRLQEAGDLPDWRIFAPVHLRHRFTPAVGFMARFPLLAHPLTARLIAPQIAVALRHDRRATLLSDENFLGQVDECLLAKAALYPNARRNLHALKRLIGAGPAQSARIVMSIRDYTDWWPSAYALLSIRHDMPDIATQIDGWMNAQRRWPDVIEDVMALFGRCDVVCYEAMASDPLVLAKALVGEAAATGQVFHYQRSISKAGLAELKDQRRRNGAPPSEVMRTIRSEDHHRSRLSSFSEGQKSALRAQYRDDLTKIATAGANIIAPPPDWPAV